MLWGLTAAGDNYLKAGDQMLKEHLEELDLLKKRFEEMRASL